MQRINIDKTLTILSIIGEEDTCLGFESNKPVQDALAVIEDAIQQRLTNGEVWRSDILLSFH